MSWLFPWWGLALAAAILGGLRPAGRKSDSQLGAAAAVAWAALAYVQDGRDFGQISRRLAGLFHLPGPALIFAVMALAAFVTAFLCARAGAVLGDLFKAGASKFKAKS
jgi:hypothetical protein